VERGEREHGNEVGMSTAARNLRIGIVFRGDIVHEEIIDRKVDISLGLRAGSTIQMAAKQYPDFPDHLELLIFEGGQFYLVVPSDPSARVSVRGANSTPATIRGKRCLPIEGAVGGSVSIGEVVVMFQFVRGDATPMINIERTVLRVGLVYDEDGLISEQIFPDQKLVTIGSAKQDTVVLPDEDYQGPSLSFVNNRDGSVTLKAPATMKVRVAVDGAPMELKELQAKGKAVQEGDNVSCHLSLGTRGRATMGKYIVLFQVVKQTVIVPALPQRSLGQRLLSPIMSDPTWSVSFLTSFAVMAAFVVQAVVFQSSTGKYLTKAKTEEAETTSIYEVQIEQKEEIKEPEPDPEEDKKETVDVRSEDAKKADEKQKEDKKADKADAKADKATDAPKADNKPAESIGKQADPDEVKKLAVENVQKKTIAGAFGGGAGGAATKLFATGDDDGAGGEVVAKTFGGTGGGDGSGGQAGPGSGGLKVASSGGGGTVEKVSGGSKGIKRDNTAAAPVKEEKKEAAAPSVKLSTGGLSGEGSDDEKSAVQKMIARKNSAVQKCYENELRDNDGAGGKVRVTFTVGPAGNVTDVSVSGAAGGFAECIKGKFMAIRGLPASDGSKTYNQSYVFAKGG